jgi:hypothetical protein
MTVTMTTTVTKNKVQCPSLSPSQRPTVLLSIYQNNTWTIRRLVNETIHWAAQCIEDCWILYFTKTVHHTTYIRWLCVWVATRPWHPGRQKSQEFLQESVCPSICLSFLSACLTQLVYVFRVTPVIVIWHRQHKKLYRKVTKRGTSRLHCKCFVCWIHRWMSANQIQRQIAVILTE